MKILNKLFATLGYKLIPAKNSYIDIDQVFSNSDNYSLYQYTKEDGSFDYAKYKKIQEEGNKNKISQTWAVEENIAFLANYLSDNLSAIKFGICHGTRRGKEQAWFKKHIKSSVEVIGTEISETAKDFPDTIQWDFHEVKDEWLNSTDFIYSNSLDHSYDPEKCLNAWMSCIRKGGFCIIEHTDHHDSSSSRELDPFGAHLLKMPILISQWGKGNYAVVDILKAPISQSGIKYTAFILIEKY